MLRSYIEKYERTFHARDNDRRSLPFEWGLDHVGLDCARSNEEAAAAIARYAANALHDSDGFYGYAPTDRYEFDGHILKFPSFIETPYASNNTVWGRFFDGGRNLAVVVLPHWNCTWEGHLGLCRALQRSHISALRLSLPYHHHRKPDEIERSEYLVSPNVGRTLTAARQAVVDARRAADWLLDRGHRRVAVVGASIGSCIAFLTFVHDERFSGGVFLHASGHFADVVWSGLSTSHVRRALEGRISLDQLRMAWSPISPFPFIPRLRGTKRRMLIVSGEYDLTFPPELSRKAHEELERYSIPAQVLWLPCGHYTLGRFPFNAIAGYRILRFLIEELIGAGSGNLRSQGRRGN